MKESADFDKVNSLLRRALLDPHSNEAANSILLAARKLTAAGVDLHEVSISTNVSGHDLRWIIDRRDRQIAAMDDAFTRVKAKLAKTERQLRRQSLDNHQFKSLLETIRMNIDITPIRAAAEYHEAEALRIRQALALLEGVRTEAPPVRPANPPRGMNNQPKFNRQQGDEIRAKLDSGITAAALAKEYGVSPATISNVKRMKAGI